MEKKTKRKPSAPMPLNDGTNSPVSGKMPAQPVSASEAALFKQAENPLGNPNKV